MAAARLARGRRAPVVGGANGGAAELLLLTANLMEVAATGGDDGDGGATRPKMAGDGCGLGERRDGATSDERARDLGQTKEEIKGKLYMGSNRRDRAANGRNWIGKNTDSVLER
jgi:Domain of unknown function (DUF834).